MCNKCYKCAGNGDFVRNLHLSSTRAQCTAMLARALKPKYSRPDLTLI